MREKIAEKRLVQIQMSATLLKAAKAEGKKLNIDLSSYVRLVLSERLMRRQENH